ncbi:hypothetical protein [Deinococcus sp. PEB2-63]
MRAALTERLHVINLKAPAVPIIRQSAVRARVGVQDQIREDLGGYRSRFGKSPPHRTVHRIGNLQGAALAVRVIAVAVRCGLTVEATVVAATVWPIFGKIGLCAGLAARAAGSEDLLRSS